MRWIEHETWLNSKKAEYLIFMFERMPTSNKVFHCEKIWRIFEGKKANDRY